MIEFLKGLNFWQWLFFLIALAMTLTFITLLGAGFINFMRGKKQPVPAEEKQDNTPKAPVNTSGKMSEVESYFKLPESSNTENPPS